MTHTPETAKQAMAAAVAALDGVTEAPWFAHPKSGKGSGQFGVTTEARFDPSRGASRRICKNGSPRSYPEVMLDAEDYSNAYFIAYARQGVPALVAELAAAVERERVLREALRNPPRHKYWRPGEPDCPREIKAGNGELHTLRCKVCGLDDPIDQICHSALSGEAQKGEK